jgi:hypothetical protein
MGVNSLISLDGLRKFMTGVLLKDLFVKEICSDGLVLNFPFCLFEAVEFQSKRPAYIGYWSFIDFLHLRFRSCSML